MLHMVGRKGCCLRAVRYKENKGSTWLCFLDEREGYCLQNDFSSVRIWCQGSNMEGLDVCHKLRSNQFLKWGLDTELMSHNKETAVLLDQQGEERSRTRIQCPASLPGAVTTWFLTNAKVDPALQLVESGHTSQNMSRR